MLVAAIVNGWSGSLRPKRNRMEAVALEVLVSSPHLFKWYSRRSTISGRMAMRGVHKFVEQYARKKSGYARKKSGGEWPDLLLIGKSLGAKNLIDYLNDRFFDIYSGYRSISLLTVDPCWPSWNKWRPNRNTSPLKLKYAHRMREVVNIYLVAPGDEQAGAPVMGSMNTRLFYPATNHFDIVSRPEVKELLGQTVSRICGV